MDFLDKINKNLSRIFVWIAGSALVAVMLLAVVNMFLRAFYVPIGATWELVGFLTAIVTAFSLGFSQLTKAHVAIDLLIQNFPLRVRLFLESITTLLSVFLFGIATWHIYQYAGRVMDQGVLSETLRIPFYPIIYAVSAAFLCFTLVLLADFFKAVNGAFKK
ncbi:MAG: TRAP transporter small permease [Bacillota bacterium]